MSKGIVAFIFKVLKEKELFDEVVKETSIN